VTELLEFVDERVRRQPPQAAYVVGGSTPVVSFGRLASARVATLGLNPSRQEFLDPSGRELDGGSRRFETRRSLGIGAADPVSTSNAARIVEACERYFLRNPYRRWFGQLEPMVRAAGGSYYDGTACHLDLVQWATNPTWAKLSSTAKTQLLVSDVPFLGRQLDTSNLDCLLINGRSALIHSSAALDIDFELESKDDRVSTYIGRYADILVIGWSINIQSSFGVTTAMRLAIGENVKVLVGAHRSDRRKPAVEEY
jgi:hypothetical protein